MSKCTRAHGISSFPDPHSGPTPGQPVGYRDIIANNGFWLGIPASINTQSPGFKRAAAACTLGPRESRRGAAKEGRGSRDDEMSPQLSFISLRGTVGLPRHRIAAVASLGEAGASLPESSLPE